MKIKNKKTEKQMREELIKYLYLDGKESQDHTH